MKAVLGLCLVGIFGISVISCLEEPQYSEIPNIEFEEIIFRDLKDASSADSLILSVKFKDGDGDIGINPSETDNPYNSKYYFVYTKNLSTYKIDFLPTAGWSGAYKYKRGAVVAYSSKYWVSNVDNNGATPGSGIDWEELFLLNYKSKRLIANYDTVPAFVKPYNCTNWEVIKNGQTVVDTIYFQLNPNYNNIFITFQIKDGAGNFQDYDWANVFTYPTCEVNGFNGRFPILSKDLTQPGPLEGTIRYAMTSAGFNFVFSIKTLRLKVKIQDRALNRSNEIFTKEFTLKSISQ